MIQAVILAGGRGTRLSPLTDRIPKAMVPVQGKPFLHHQIDLLRAAGLSDVLLLVGHLGSQIVRYLGDGSRFGMRIRYAREETPLGTAGALSNAGKGLEADFLLLNGDTLLEIDHARLVEAYRSQQPWGLIVAFENPARTIPNNLALAPDGRIVRYDKRGGTDLTHVDAGVAVFSRRILECIPSRRASSLAEEVYPLLIERRTLRGYSTAQPFYDMGTFDGLRSLEEAVSSS